MCLSILFCQILVEARDHPPSAHVDIHPLEHYVRPENPELSVTDMRKLFKISFYNKICTSTSATRETLNQYYYDTERLKRLLPHLDIDNLIYKPGKKTKLS